MQLLLTVEREAKEAREAMAAYRDHVQKVFDGPLSVFREKGIATQYFRDVETVMTQFLNPVPKEFQKTEIGEGRCFRQRSKKVDKMDLDRFIRCTEREIMQYTKSSRRQGIMSDFHNLLHSFARNQPKPIVSIDLEEDQEFIRFDDLNYKNASLPFIADQFHKHIIRVDIAFAPFFEIMEREPTIDENKRKDEYLRAQTGNLASEPLSIGILLYSKEKALSSIILTGKTKDVKKTEHVADLESNFSMYVSPIMSSFWGNFNILDCNKKCNVKMCTTPIYCRDLSFLMRNVDVCKAINERVQFLVTATKSMRYLAEKHSGNVFFSKAW